MGKNTSGFYSYGMRNLYPNFGGYTQSEETTPDDADQQKMNVTENVQSTGNASPKTTRGFWVMLAIVAVLFVVFGFGGKGN